MNMFTVLGIGGAFLAMSVLAMAGTEGAAKKPDTTGMTELPSGLKYRVMKEGTGAIPKASDQVEVHYRGTFMTGEEFDSSYARGTPAVFGVTQVIKGWTEALQLMKTGSKWEVFIPFVLAYGEKGRPPVIPPMSPLFFEIELISIK